MAKLPLRLTGAVRQSAPAHRRSGAGLSAANRGMAALGQAIRGAGQLATQVATENRARESRTMQNSAFGMLQNNLVLQNEVANQKVVRSEDDKIAMVSDYKDQSMQALNDAADKTGLTGRPRDDFINTGMVKIDQSATSIQVLADQKWADRKAELTYEPLRNHVKAQSTAAGRARYLEFDDSTAIALAEALPDTQRTQNVIKAARIDLANAFIANQINTPDGSLAVVEMMDSGAFNEPYSEAEQFAFKVKAQRASDGYAARELNSLEKSIEASTKAISNHAPGAQGVDEDLIRAKFPPKKAAQLIDSQTSAKEKWLFIEGFNCKTPAELDRDYVSIQ